MSNKPLACRLCCWFVGELACMFRRCAMFRAAPPVKSNPPTCFVKKYCNGSPKPRLVAGSAASGSW